MCLKPIGLSSGLVVPCGKCLECCKKYSNEWAVRIMDEAKNHLQTCFITLTYAETGPDLVKSDFQKFMKRLRSYLEPQEIRFFLCGEYGGKGNRPHAHCIVFGWKPPDLKPLFMSGKNQIYTSDIVAKIWQSKSKTAFASGNVPGYVTVGDLSIDSARYCAKYMQKLDIRPHTVSPFILMSRRPGIGACAVDPKYLSFGERWINGKQYPIPRYYINRLENEGYNTEILKARRRWIKDQKTETDFGTDEWYKRQVVKRKAVENNFENLLTKRK